MAMLSKGSSDDGCSLRMWNGRRTIAPEEWDWRRIYHGACGMMHLQWCGMMGTGQEQDCALGNGMDMGLV